MKRTMIALCAAALSSVAFAEEPAAPCACPTGGECVCAPCACPKPPCEKPPCEKPPCACPTGGECACAPCACPKPDCERPPCDAPKCDAPKCDKPQCGPRGPKAASRPAVLFLDAKTDPAAIEAYKREVIARIDKAAADVAAGEGVSAARIMLIVNDRPPRRAPRRFTGHGWSLHVRPVRSLRAGTSRS